MEIILGVSPMAWSLFAPPTATKPRRSAVHRLTISLGFWRENSAHSPVVPTARQQGIPGPAFLLALQVWSRCGLYGETFLLSSNAKHQLALWRHEISNGCCQARGDGLIC